MAIREEKDRDDVMDRLLQLGGDKKFLSYDDLNRELPENVVSPDDIEDVISHARLTPGDFAVTVCVTSP